MDARARVGRNLKRLRRQKYLTQEELAYRSGIHQTYLSGIERGVRNPTVTAIEKIADALGVDPGELLTRHEG